MSYGRRSLIRRIIFQLMVLTVLLRDIESCDPAKPFENTIFEKEFSPSREVASIADNIDVVISSFPQQGNSSTRILKINKFVFLSEESYHSNSVNAKYVQELAGRDYTKLTCSKKTGVGLFMRGIFIYLHEVKHVLLS